MNIKDFYIGKTFDAYEYFGAHITDEGVVFRVYAPAASKVSLIGEFNEWKETAMEKEPECYGVYVCKVKDAKAGQMYKYKIYQSNGYAVDKADPYGFGMELRPNSASIIRDLNEYKFTDEEWLSNRTKNYNTPMNIYEMHMGSWKTKEDGSWKTYSEIADELLWYVKENGYTHIEFLPLSEHPADCSWGYQLTGFFSPTSRYGTARDLKELIDKCHNAGVGVIMDFVPVHFALDDYGLINFDGNNLYEYPSTDVGYSEWGSCNFMHSRGEVCSFLQSSANYWLTEFHFDGLRMDAISNALYWQGDPARGVNGCTVNFIKNMNMGLHKLHPTAMLIAEDSTSYLKVTAPVEYDGLGFDYKWDMGWMNDTLEFFKLAPKDRVAAYYQLTFSMKYFYNELYLLPFSHDEVVHGKKTIIDKIYGDYEDKFKQCKVLYAYMYTHPGKKLNFMGNEIGQFREWDEKRQQDWEILGYPIHDAFHRFIIDLNLMYKNNEILYNAEYNSENFKFIEEHAQNECIYAYQRSFEDKSLITVLNLSDNEYKEFNLGVDKPMVIREIMNTDYEKYHGETKEYEKEIAKAKKSGAGEKPYYVSVDLKPYQAKIYEVEYLEEIVEDELED